MCAASGVIPAGCAESSSPAWKPEMSAPAENARSPRPRRTTHRASPTLSSSDQRCSVIPREIAFSGGLSSQIVLIMRPSSFRRLSGVFRAPERRGRPKRASRRLLHLREHLAQRDLAELADRRLRDLLDELEAVGQPPLRELRREELAQLVRRRRLAGLEDDRRERPLVPLRVRDRAHG